MSKIFARSNAYENRQSGPSLLLVLGLTLLLSIVLFGCNEEKQKSVIGVVDAEAVFQKSKLAAAGMQHIDALNAEMQNQLAAMQNQLMASPDDAALESSLQNDLFAMQTRMDQSQRQVAEKINAIFDQAVEECRVAQGLEVVLPKQLVMASGPEADITELVVAAMDKNTVDFSDIKLEDAAAPQADTATSATGGDAAQGDATPAGDVNAESTAASQTEPTGEAAQPAETAGPVTETAAPAGEPVADEASDTDAAPAETGTTTGEAASSDAAAQTTSEAAPANETAD